MTPFAERGVMTRHDAESALLEHARRLFDELKQVRDVDADPRQRAARYAAAARACGEQVAKIVGTGFAEVEQAYNLHRASSERLLAEYLDRALTAERELAALKQK